MTDTTNCIKCDRPVATWTKIGAHAELGVKSGIVAHISCLTYGELFAHWNIVDHR